MIVSCTGEEWCPITCTADLIGKKWYPVIIHRLLQFGTLRFNELQREVDGISSRVLSDNLEDMEEKQLVERTIVNAKPVEVEYALTDRGASLEPVIEAMVEWGETYLVPADEDYT